LLPPFCLKKPLLLWVDVGVDVAVTALAWVDPDDVWLAVTVVVVPTWWKATRPLRVPKLTTEATTSPFFNLRASANARAFGIRSAVSGF
jgi:hypothetical protein